MFRRSRGSTYVIAKGSDTVSVGVNGALEGCSLEVVVTLLLHALSAVQSRHALLFGSLAQRPDLLNKLSQ